MPAMTFACSLHRYLVRKGRILQAELGARVASFCLSAPLLGSIDMLMTAQGSRASQDDRLVLVAKSVHGCWLHRLPMPSMSQRHRRKVEGFGSSGANDGKCG